LSIPESTTSLSPPKGRGTAWAIEHRYTGRQHEDGDDGEGNPDQQDEAQRIPPATPVIEETVKPEL